MVGMNTVKLPEIVEGKEMKAQRKNKGYLFICCGNVHRSRTAEDVCRKLAEERNLPIKASSAGISPFAENPATKEMADQADTIFVMEEYMKTHLQTYCRQRPEKIFVLGVPDTYERNNPSLVELLTKKLDAWLCE